MADETHASGLDAWNERMAAAIGGSIPMRFEEVSKQRVVMTMPIGPHVHQPSGVLHGGASMVLAESAASIGAMILTTETLIADKPEPKKEPAMPGGGMGDYGGMM